MSPRSTLRALSLLAALALPAAAAAHGDVAHSIVQIASSTLAPADRRVQWAEAGGVELGLDAYRLDVGAPLDIRVYTTDAATNAPLDARVTVELPALNLRAEAGPAGAPGIMHALIDAPPAAYDLIVTVETPTRVELFELRDVDWRPRAAPAADPTRRDLPLPALLAAALLVGLIIGALVGRRSGRGLAAGAAATSLIVLAALAFAHGGEAHDHGEPQAALATGKGTGDTELTKPAQLFLGVRTVPATRQPIAERLWVYGHVTPRNDASAAVPAPVAGRVLSGAIPAQGDRVKRGDVLFVIEQTPGAADAGQLRAEALRARAARAQAEAREAHWRREVARLTSLTNVVPAIERQRAELELQLATQAAQQARAEQGLFGNKDLVRTPVLAPIDGVVARVDLRAGEAIAAGATAVLLVEPSRLWVEADIFEADLPRVKPGAAASLKVAGLDALTPATLWRGAQQIDPATRAARVIFEVDNPTGALLPGMFAQLGVELGGRSEQIVIPDDALIEEGGRRFVYVRRGPELFARREIILGPRDGERVAVSAGVAPGDRVVTQGTYQLRTTR